MGKVVNIRPQILILTCECGGHEWEIEISDKTTSLKDDILKIECQGCGRVYDHNGEPLNAQVRNI